MTPIKRFILGLTLWACAFGAWSASTDQTCDGQFPNPITDICWSCIFPMKIGTASVSTKGQEDNGTSPDWVCACSGKGGTASVGVGVSFWEPIRIAEFVRTPYCFPSLGGITMDSGGNAPRHTQRASGDASKRKANKAPEAFYQGHWYINPVMFYIESLLETRCLEQNVFDIAYTTELDPLWADSQSTFILNPDVVLFSNPIAIAACAGDCIATTTGFANDLAFWCAGCQGSMYPLVGWVSTHTGGVNATSLLMQRLTNKLHRQGQMWAASGKEGQCGYYVEPLMKKTNYKYSMLYPRAQSSPKASSTSSTPRCCQPFGRTTADWASGKEFPIKGEDFSYQIYRKRDCCQGAF